MGLAGRKSKQRIGADPRNLTWADNAAKFGQAYLSRLGWDPSKGLGVDGDGRTSHIKVAQKLNMLGIGAGAPQGPDGVAWKQNRDYEMLLKRLNESSKPEEGTLKEPTARTSVSLEEDEEVAGTKRKREDELELKSEDESENKRKKEKKDMKMKKEKKGKGIEDNENEVVPESQTHAPAEPTPAVLHVPRPMAHRARFLRSKQLASKSSTAVAEILGISPSTSTGVSSSASPYPPSSYPGSTGGTPFPVDGVSDAEKMEQLTTSTKSVADYFKEKLAARSRPGSGTSTPAPVPGDEEKAAVDDEQTRRSGIGSRMLSRGEESDAPRTGLGSGMRFGGLMGGLNITSFSVASTSTTPKGKADDDVIPNSAGDLKSGQKKGKKEKGDKKGKKDKKKKNKEDIAEDENDSALEEPEAERPLKLSAMDLPMDANTATSKAEKDPRQKEKKEKKERKEKKRREREESS